MSVDGDGDGGELTLAFSVSAIERLADPAAAFEDAEAWSRYLGVVDEDRDAVARVLDEHRLRQDFDQGDRDIWLALEGIRESTRTPRHVYVGTSAADRRVATHLGWEFVPVVEAAEKAGWDLGDGDTTDGVVSRLLRALPGRLSRFGSK